jgi:hypothetical protein
MWLDQASAWLAPAMEPEADFWDGWGAVRYLDDQFARLYRLQDAFVKAILTRISPSDALQLKQKTTELKAARRKLDRVGRRKGMAQAVAAACALFLGLFEAWLEEIQRLMQGVTRAELPPPAQEALARLQAALADRA